MNKDDFSRDSQSELAAAIGDLAKLRVKRVAAPATACSTELVASEAVFFKSSSGAVCTLHWYRHLFAAGYLRGSLGLRDSASPRPCFSAGVFNKGLEMVKFALDLA
jgi:hypothetical protein